jgi:hypothetical protein
MEARDKRGAEGQETQGDRGMYTSLRMQPSQMKTDFVGWVVQTTLASRWRTLSRSTSLGPSTVTKYVLKEYL